MFYYGKSIIASLVLAIGAITTTIALIPSMLKKETQNITIETKDIKNPIVDSVVDKKKKKQLLIQLLQQQ